MYNICIIKNIDSEIRNVLGVELAPNDIYQIPDNKRIMAINNNTLLNGISLGIFQIGNGTNYYTTTSDQLNCLKNIPLNEIDEEGRQINRTAYGKKGWTYLAHPIEFTTSKLSSVFSKNWKQIDRSDYTLKFYDINGTELTTQTSIDSSCVETRLTLSPDYDYEIISGTVDIHTSTTSDIRMWVVGGVIDNTTNYPWEYPASSGIYHVKEFAGGVNFKFIEVSQKLETDGRASKFMAKTKEGIPYNANQFQIIMTHPAGVQHDFVLTLEYFRE